jgi:hypothetical protein
MYFERIKNRKAKKRPFLGGSEHHWERGGHKERMNKGEYGRRI